MDIKKETKWMYNRFKKKIIPLKKAVSTKNYLLYLLLNYKDESLSPPINSKHKSKKKEIWSKEETLRKNEGWLSIDNLKNIGPSIPEITTGKRLERFTKILEKEFIIEISSDNFPNKLLHYRVHRNPIVFSNLFKGDKSYDHLIPLPSFTSSDYYSFMMENCSELNSLSNEFKEFKEKKLEYYKIKDKIDKALMDINLLTLQKMIISKKLYKNEKQQEEKTVRKHKD